jgi:hypothetical protein
MREPLAASTETGSLGVHHLKRIWSAAAAARTGAPARPGDEGPLDHLVINAMGLSLHQAYEYLYRVAPTFEQFEQWIVATAGRPDPVQVDRLNADIAGAPRPQAVRARIEAIESAPPALSADDLAFWEENGYVVLRQAVPEEARAAAEDTVWRFVGAASGDPQSWYQRANPAKHGIMVELIQHAAFDANRRAPRIHKAFAQLWGTADLWVTADRCGFHPPQREDWPFQGPDLHWDCDLARPREFGTQGILYLTDTPPEQGALTLVPGFHRRLADWLSTLAPGADPHHEDLHALGSVPVGANAGDMVIWHHALPHGSRPNLGTRPRIVQYINLFPGPGPAQG